MAEFSRHIPIETITLARQELAFDASAAECAALAERFAVEALEALRGRAHVHRLDKDRIRLEAEFQATIVQQSVVTLEPVRQVIKETFAQDYLVTAAPDAVDDEESKIDLEGEDPPEPVEGEAIDVGEAVAQRLALAIDPYPVEPDLPPDHRHKVLAGLIAETGGAITVGSDDGKAKEEAESPKPFDVLRKLKLNG